MTKLRARLAQRARGWLTSHRPSWAMMPRHNAALMVDTLLTTVSVLERQGVTYSAHQGSLLGAAHLGGLLPWDIDADLAIIDENAETAAAKLREPLREHGLALVFSPEDYYYTIRPFTEVRLPGLGRRTALLVPFVEVILLTPSRDASTGALWFDRHSPHRMFAPGELLPLRRYPWHGSYLLGPAQPNPVLERLYGSDGAGAALRGFALPALDEETASFWAEARPLDGEPDFTAIARRAERQQHNLGRQLAGAPWYLANGLYGSLVEAARRRAGGR